MKLLLDECIDRRLTKEFIKQNIKTVPQMATYHLSKIYQSSTLQ
ncbi:MAG: hypothetical protein QNJ41_16400 [Xenococcaceae cyanobacterium MO_188.B32]|nr:hypothetical protein [Xenococcaceae cyanobacterium MO_188.B32]